MTDDPKPQQEPSMEEILASIRRIISEDEADEAQAAPPEPAPEPEPEPPAEPEAFDLTQEVRDDGTVVDLATGRTIAEPEAPELVEEEPEPAPPPPVAPPPAVAPPPRLDEGLVGPPAAAAATDSFAALAQAVVGDRAARDMGIGGRTIEDLVKEVLRPMIKEWLDANLPALVERLVSREIDRMSRRAEDEADL